MSRDYGDLGDSFQSPDYQINQLLNFSALTPTLHPKI